jgi:hypothetical protein
MWFVAIQAPVAQGIEHCPPEAGAQVRILSGALNHDEGEINHLTFEIFFPLHPCLTPPQHGELHTHAS